MYLIILSDCIAICMCVCVSVWWMFSSNVFLVRLLSIFLDFLSTRSLFTKKGELGSFFIGSDPARWDPHFSTPLGPFGWFVGRLGTFGDWKERKKDTPERESGIVGAERVISLLTTTIKKSKLHRLQLFIYHSYMCVSVWVCKCVCIKNSFSYKGGRAASGAFFENGPRTRKRPRRLLRF
jgi:hypothetical protein